MNRERNIKRATEYFQTHREEIRESKRKYFQTHKKEIQFQQNCYHALHREEIREYSRMYNRLHSNPSELKDYLEKRKLIREWRVQMLKNLPVEELLERVGYYEDEQERNRNLA
jgi:iron-sulfur cluster repair protein YtfE (RIC family)